MSHDLASWNDGPAVSAILDFVERVTNERSSRFVPPSQRIAVFDNDGTLWCEKPMPIELGFIVQRLAAQADCDAALRGRQPWKAAVERDYDWLGNAITKHYRGDDSDVKVLAGGILRAFAGMSVEEYQTAACGYLQGGQHPILDRPLRQCGYQPMIELVRLLETSGFTTYIVSGGSRDFMRTVTNEIYGIPSERVVGSSTGLRYREGKHGGSVVYLAEPDVFDDGPIKPVRIWSRVGRRPILGGGNSNGDVPMLQYTGGTTRPALRLLVLHDDPDREFDYTAGAEHSLDQAKAQGWTVVSMRYDWKTVFTP